MLAFTGIVFVFKLHEFVGGCYIRAFRVLHRFQEGFLKVALHKLYTAGNMYIYISF